MHIKEDCYWYWYDNDMGARIPYCTAKKGNQPLESCDECVKYHSKYKRTNADRIRAMTDEELAKWLDNLINHCCEGQCVNCFMREACQTSMIAWLKSTVEEGEG